MRRALPPTSAREAEPHRTLVLRSAPHGPDQDAARGRLAHLVHGAKARMHPKHQPAKPPAARSIAAEKQFMPTKPLNQATNGVDSSPTPGPRSGEDERPAGRFLALGGLL